MTEQNHQLKNDETRLKTFILLSVLLVVIPLYLIQAPDDFAKSGISVSIVVEDLNKSLDFYPNVIGMVKTDEFNIEAARAKELGLSNGNEYRLGKSRTFQTKFHAR